MHRFAKFLFFGAIVTVLGAPGHAQQDKQPQLFETPYYPLREGSHWVYKVTVDDSPGDKEVSIAVEKKETYVYKYVLDKTGKEEPIWRYALKVVSGPKELTEHVAVLKDGVYRFSTANKDISPPLCFLKLPITSGGSWKVDSTSENVQLTGTFKCDDASVKVPAGAYPAKHISSKDFMLGTEKMVIDYWFAPDVGIVKQHIRVGNNGVLMELKEFKAGK